MDSPPNRPSDPWQNGQPFANIASSGFGYASFFLGATSSVSTAAPADVRLGTHSFGFYVQDSWKITRKLTFDYGLRWDYAMLWKEQYGRMQNAAFNQPNTLIGGRLGTVEYQATCNCKYANAYPFAIRTALGSRVPDHAKTVFRAGGAISYATTSDQAGLNSSAGDFYTIPAPAYGADAGQLMYGDPLGPGNHLGNPVVHWPNFSPNFPVPAAPGVIPPASPFVSIAPNTGRLPRTFQWSLGFQREITRNLVVDAAYVGNRGAWWAGPLLAGLNYNAVTPQYLQSQYGLNVANPADTTLLNTQINSPNVIQRFPSLANPASVYPGFPNTQTLLQATAAVSAVERHPAVPWASRWKYVVRLAPGEGDPALAARPEHAVGLHVAEGAHQRDKLQHVLRDAFAAAHQRRVQQSAGQADLRFQCSAGD